MIEETVERWHRHLRGELPGGLDALLSDDVVFYSPCGLHAETRQGITKLYLQAAKATSRATTSATGTAAPVASAT